MKTDHDHYRNLIEQALRESEGLLRQIAANYPNSYLSIIEPDLTIGFTAGQEFRNQGLDPAAFVGLTLEQVFGEQAPLVREHYLRTFAGAETEFELFLNDQHQLYRTVPLVEIEPYLLGLVADLQLAYGARAITTRVEAPGVVLDLDRATACGLLVSELVSNALKHAFPLPAPRR
jgi:hypothetical protein